MMVKIITPEQMNKIIEDPHNFSNKGKFMYITKNDNYVCCDNQTGDALVKEFSSLITATKWLNGLFDYSDLLFEPRVAMHKISSGNQ
jgi:hypothetical protein